MFSYAIKMKINDRNNIWKSKYSWKFKILRVSNYGSKDKSKLKLKYT